MPGEQVKLNYYDFELSDIAKAEEKSVFEARIACWLYKELMIYDSSKFSDAEKHDYIKNFFVRLQQRVLTLKTLLQATWGNLDYENFNREFNALMIKVHQYLYSNRYYQRNLQSWYTDDALISFIQYSLVRHFHSNLGVRRGFANQDEFAGLIRAAVADSSASHPYAIFSFNLNQFVLCHLNKYCVHPSISGKALPVRPEEDDDHNKIAIAILHQNNNYAFTDAEYSIKCVFDALNAYLFQKTRFDQFELFQVFLQFLTTIGFKYIYLLDNDAKQNYLSSYAEALIQYLETNANKVSDDPREYPIEALLLPFLKRILGASVDESSIDPDKLAELLAKYANPDKNNELSQYKNGKDQRNISEFYQSVVKRNPDIAAEGVCYYRTKREKLRETRDRDAISIPISGARPASRSRGQNRASELTFRQKIKLLYEKFKTLPTKWKRRLTLLLMLGIIILVGAILLAPPFTLVIAGSFVVGVNVAAAGLGAGIIVGAVAAAPIVAHYADDPKPSAGLPQAVDPRTPVPSSTSSPTSKKRVRASEEYDSVNAALQGIVMTHEPAKYETAQADGVIPCSWQRRFTMSKLRRNNSSTRSRDSRKSTASTASGNEVAQARNGLFHLQQRSTPSEGSPKPVRSAYSNSPAYTPGVFASPVPRFFESDVDSEQSKTSGNLSASVLKLKSCEIFDTPPLGFDY